MKERDIILEAVMAILEHGEYTDRTISGLLLKYSDVDRHFRALLVREVTGVVENKLYLDYIISRESTTKLNKMKPVVRNVLRIAVFEIYFMDSIGDHAAVDEAVKLVKKRGLVGLSGFVNGVLRAVARRHSGETEGTVLSAVPDNVRYSIPDEVWELWGSEYGADKALGFAKAFAEQEKGTLTVRPCGIGEEELAASLESAGAKVRSVVLSDVLGVDVRALSVSGIDRIEECEDFKRGRFYIQDISSMAVALAASPKPGDEVIDVCAAPGGKATHIAELLGGTGHVDARDISAAKVGLIEENIARLGLSNISAKVWDAAIPDEDAVGSADIVIADLPCTGLGVIGKKPDIRYGFTQEKLHALSKMQENILSTVSQYVRPGGRLVYSTCTMTAEENGKNVDKFLNQNLSFREMGRQQILPGTDPDRDGFFICVMEREG